MRMVAIISLSLIPAACTYSNRDTTKQATFIRVHGQVETDARWAPGIKPPSWYDESDVDIEETAKPGRSMVSIEAKLITWESPESLYECQQMFRLDGLSDTDFCEIGERKARGIFSGRWLRACLTAPPLNLFEGQSNVTAVTSTQRRPSFPVRQAGVFLFVKVTAASDETATLRLSAQSTISRHGWPPPGYRLPCLTVAGERTMRIGEWYMKLAESEEPRSPTALMVRITGVSPPAT